MKIPKSHPRYTSLMTRKKIVNGVKKGITSIHGLLAHGRGEAFDYLLKERTHKFSKSSITAAVALLLIAKNPVISVNGNSTVLVSKELIKLAELLNCPLEVNIFHGSKVRERTIQKYLLSLGGKTVLMPTKNNTIDHLESNRKFVNPEGIKKADVVFVPLEDGDRAKALIRNGKKVITIDLNPLSRTAQAASVTIVDNIIRVMPLIIECVSHFKNLEKKELRKIVKEYNNKKILNEAVYSLRLK